MIKILESNINVVFYQLTIIEVKACGVNKKSLKIPRKIIIMYHDIVIFLNMVSSDIANWNIEGRSSP